MHCRSRRRLVVVSDCFIIVTPKTMHRPLRSTTRAFYSRYAQNFRCGNELGRRQPEIRGGAQETWQQIGFRGRRAARLATIALTGVAASSRMEAGGATDIG
jgi:hypothetical protein